MPFRPAEIPRAARLDSLTGLRWLAALAVFAFHMNNLAPIPAYPALRFGNYGVMFFFLLSGFVLTWATSPSLSATTFWWRRFSRIYPAFFVALVLAIPVFYSFAPDPAQTWVKPVNIGILLLTVVLVQGWWRDPVVLFAGNPVGWTLTFEAFFYSLHPALSRLLRRLNLRGTFIAGLVIVLAAFAYRAAVLIWPDSFVDLPGPIARLSEFALGMCAAQALRLGWLPRLSPVALYVAGAAFIAWVVLTPVFLRGGAMGFLDGGLLGVAIRAGVNEWMLILCLLLVVSVASRDIRGGRSILRSKVLVKLGEWSYSFYLIHSIAIYTVLEVVGRQPNSWKGLLWYPGMLAISIALAAALHYFVEKPCERFLRSRWDRRLAERSAARVAEPASVEPAPV